MSTINPSCSSPKVYNFGLWSKELQAYMSKLNVWPKSDRLKKAFEAHSKSHKCIKQLEVDTSQKANVKICSMTLNKTEDKDKSCRPEVKMEAEFSSEIDSVVRLETEIGPSRRKDLVPTSKREDNKITPVKLDRNDNASPGDGVSSEGIGVGGHPCSYCGKLYSRKYGLKIHLRTHTGHKPLQCLVCRRRFGDPSNLNKHLRLHAANSLEHCVFGGTGHGNRGREDSNDSGCERPEGGRSVLVQATLARHLAITSPYRCLDCGKVLVRRRDLERHMRTRHAKSPCRRAGVNKSMNYSGMK
ncbi:unnamed protein product [Protopolystoma xenopodis]|uniref:C2H2-type domain-containing protein n=1 Tax=Protopolystoma xenopodis TaxID=117903 RepID=A0A448WCV6_9PLAT|nr:unnamed protein product [Protopolystoma xenopodis]